ncbi:MAG: NIPSNAP family containing protein, partial [Verrucomicrobia bacterium]|nr:NIPSNAP family containing protein [Verrucomicrobiota bacterium]NDE97576.1 NIPSNAP family containing protein [Verrucomicrobiota bacterium]
WTFTSSFGCDSAKTPTGPRPRRLSAGKRKIEMFNRGELAIFKRTGLTPVMFAETLSGTLMPNLTYLLVFPNDDARKKAWDTFRADPEWLKLKAVPEYADKEIVLKVTNRLLTPTPYSEL